MIKLATLLALISLISCVPSPEQIDTHSSSEQKQDGKQSISVNEFGLKFYLPAIYEVEKINKREGLVQYYFKKNTPEKVGILHAVFVQTREYIAWSEKYCRQPDIIYRCPANYTMEHFVGEARSLANKETAYFNGEGIMEYIEINGMPYYAWHPPLIGDSSVTIRDYETYVNGIKIVVSISINKDIKEQDHPDSALDKFFTSLGFFVESQEGS